MRRLLLPCLIFAPLLSLALFQPVRRWRSRRSALLMFAAVALLAVTAALVWAWPLLFDAHAVFDTRAAPPPEDAGQVDDILLENPRGLALATGVWITKAHVPLPSDDKMEQLAKTNPLAFIKYCARRYDYTVQGYQLTFKKQERLAGTLQPSETIVVQFREEPFSVLFEWVKGERLAKKALFVRGENNNQLLVKPAGLLSIAGIQERDPEGKQAKDSGRYPLTEFGLKLGTLRTIAAWENARENKALHTEYVGQKKIPEVGERVCYVLKRLRYEKPEEDGVCGLTIYVDKETWLQVGSTLKNADGDLIAEYWFSDIKLNPEFKRETFMRNGLK